MTPIRVIHTEDNEELIYPRSFAKWLDDVFNCRDARVKIHATQILRNATKSAIQMTFIPELPGEGNIE